MMEFPKPESNIEKWLMKREITLFFFSAGVSRLASREVISPASVFLVSSAEDILVIILLDTGQSFSL